MHTRHRERDDIRLHVDKRLPKGGRALPPFLRIWESTAQEKDMLVGMSGELFVIAATAVRFIPDRNRLNLVSQLSTFGTAEWEIQLPRFTTPP